MARRMAGTGVAFHAMHPGWADTPGLAAALPRFRRVMRPLLRTPEQGADTITWLATADPALLAAAASGATADAGPSTWCRGHARTPARAGCCGTGAPSWRGSTRTFRYA